MCPSPRGACLVPLRALGGRPSLRASPRLLPIPPSSSPTSVGRPCPSRRQCPEAPVEGPSLVTVSHRRLGAGAAQPRQAVADALCFPALALSSRCQLSVPTAPSALPPGASAPSAGRGPPLCLCPAPGKGPESLSRPWEGARVSVPPLGRRPALSPPPHSSPGENGPAPLVLVLREAPLGEAPVLVMARVSGRLPEPSGQLLAAGRGRVSPRPQRAARAVPGAAWCPPSGTGVGPCPGPVPSQPQRGGVPCGQERSLPHAFLLAARFHFLRFPEPQHPGRWVLRRGERGWWR